MVWVGCWWIWKGSGIVVGIGFYDGLCRGGNDVDVGCEDGFGEVGLCLWIGGLLAKGLCSGTDLLPKFYLFALFYEHS